MLKDQISFPSTHRIRYLPGLSAPDYMEEESLTASTCSVGTALRDSLDDVDQGCFITNVHRHTDKRAYMVNDQQDDPKEKQDVETLLVDLGLAQEGFNLDDISNIIWLDATLHTAFNKYELFAITVSLDYGKDILRVLSDDLARRQLLMDQTGRSTRRPFQYFHKPQFQLVALHPDHLLPHGSTLLRRKPNNSYTAYKAASDKLLRVVEPENFLSSQPPYLFSPAFPPFIHESTRNVVQTLNVYFVLLNAEIKFQRFAKNIGLDKLHPDMRAVVEQTIQIVDLMYARPVPPDVCNAVKASGFSTLSTLSQSHGAGAAVHAEDKHLDGMDTGDVVGERSDAASRRTEKRKLPFSWDTLCLEERMAVGRDLFSRGSAFRRRCVQEHAEGASEIRTTDEIQGSHASPLLVTPNHRNQDVRDWIDCTASQ